MNQIIRVLLLLISTQSIANAAIPAEIERAIQTASFRYSVPTSIIKAIIQVESTFNPYAVSQGNYGLMQVNIRYHRHKFTGSFFKPFDNIMVGTSIYRDCLNKHHLPRPALLCYNGSNLRQAYANKVLVAERKYL